jgi:hypothetical protein
LGSLNFDSLYVVRARPVGLAAEVFSRERRASLMASILSLGIYGGCSLLVRRQQLRIGIWGDVSEEAPFLDLRRVAEEWLPVLEETKRVAEVVWIEEPGKAIGQCQVCSTEMRGDVVHRRRCRTPHHRQCREYAGLCSTFGCGESGHAGERGTPLPPGAIAASRARLGPYRDFRSEGR